MTGRSPRWLLRLSSLELVAIMVAAVIPLLSAQTAGNSPQATTSQAQTGPAQDRSILPRGKKLMLKDGSFHLVREYTIQGDRVHYYSVERSQWEEIPSALVDWDATKKIEAQEAQQDAAIVARVHNQETARTAESLDIDASLEVARQVFLPPGAGLFAFDGKSISQVPQAETTSKLAKGHFIEQVMVPVPIIPTRHSVSIQGEHAKLRLRTSQPEFYMRPADTRQPDMELIRAKEHGGSRQIENVDELFGEQNVAGHTISMQCWEVARGVYRYTLSQPLPPGEYAMAEIVRDEGTSIYVWDFGVEEGSQPSGQDTKK
jgi:hypothetical protein